ncbi:MAG: ABC transporter ATP-binding protein [Chromatiales bacterium]|jgi:ABC-2 type transport system ATP-binding protein
MEALLHTEQLSRAYNGRYVVDCLDLTLRRGEILGLLGPNGAGKSTALRMLCGDLAPSRGRVRICGHDLQTEPLAAKRQLGYLPERPPLHPDQRVDEYLLDVARLRRIARSQQRELVDQAKQGCGLERVGRRLISNLSKGYQQRVGIAQAILHLPSVIILDEPTDGLDPSQIREARELIRNLAQSAGVILSSHILPEIQALCTKVVILQEGLAVYQGTLSSPQGRRLKIKLKQPVEPAQLADLTAVKQVEPLSMGSFEVELESHSEASQLAEQIVRQGWGLQQLIPQAQDLERLFLRATTGERLA